MATGNGAPRAICMGNCWAGATTDGNPVMVTDGVAGSLTLIVKRSWELLRALSSTVTANEKLPAATGAPLTSPELASIARPEGRPFADHVYGGKPPEAVNCCENGALK